MPSRTTLTYQHAMSFCEFYYSVYLAYVRNCLFEQRDVHGHCFEFLVKFAQLFLHQLLQLLSLLQRHFDVDLSALRLIKEIHENCIVFLMVCALLDVRLQCGFQLIGNQFLQLVPVLN